MTSFLAHDGFSRGQTLAWLAAGTPEAQALHEKFGFRRVGDEFTYQAASGVVAL